MRSRFSTIALAVAACLVVVSPALANTIYLPLTSTAVTSTPVFGSHPLLNGDFEQGPGIGWRLGPYASTIYQRQALAHTGAWSAELTGIHGLEGEMTQIVDVPPTAPVLVYWGTNLGPQNANVDCGYGYVSVNTTLVDQADICTSTAIYAYTQHSINLQAYAGQTVTLRFWVQATLGRSITWFIDDVAFVATTPTNTLTPTTTLTAIPTTALTPSLTATPTNTPTSP